MRGNSHARCGRGEKSETSDTVDLPILIVPIAEWRSENDNYYRDYKKKRKAEMANAVGQ